MGWSMKLHTRTELAADALRMAWFRLRPQPGLTFHGDRGSQYCIDGFREALEGYAMSSSMSSEGDFWGNAVTESLWGSLKVARLNGRRFET